MYAHHTLTCLLYRIPSPQVVFNEASCPAPKQRHMTTETVSPKTQEFYFLCSRTMGNRKKLRFSLVLQLPRKTPCVVTSSWRWIPWSLAQQVPEMRLMIHIWPPSLPRKSRPRRAHDNFLEFSSQDNSNTISRISLMLCFSFNCT